VQSSAIDAVTCAVVFVIFVLADASGHGPLILPVFSWSKHLVKALM